MNIEKVVNELVRELGKDKVRTDDEVISSHLRDYTEDIVGHPYCVVFPENEEDIIRVVEICSRERVPVVPCGGLTGLSGGAIPINGGIVISTKKMNKIISIDTVNSIVDVEPGVITGELQRHVGKMGLWYPVEPASKDSCTIGGNVAENAGGIRSMKYGTTINYVLNLRVVLPTGDAIETGAGVHKNVMGYNLTHLFVGSEGTLGVFTKITLKIVPWQGVRTLLFFELTSFGEGVDILHKIMLIGIYPSACEMMDYMSWNLGVGASHSPSSYCIREGKCAMLIELEGYDTNQINQMIEKVYKTIGIDFEVAMTEDEQTLLWNIRRGIGSAVRGRGPYRELDCVVPRSHIQGLYELVSQLRDRYNVEIFFYGHAGDGNMHINVVKESAGDNLDEITRCIYSYVGEVGGSLTGEHGTGIIAKKYLHMVMAKKTIELYRQIKRIFDPYNIMNPGKIIDIQG